MLGGPMTENPFLLSLSKATLHRRAFCLGTSASALLAASGAAVNAAAPFNPSMVDFDIIKRTAPTALRYAAPVARIAFRALPVVGQLSLALDLALIASDVFELTSHPGAFRTRIESPIARKAMTRLGLLGVGASSVLWVTDAFGKELKPEAASKRLTETIGSAGRLESELGDLAELPGVIRSIVQDELEANNRGRLETKLEEFAKITNLLEQQAAKAPLIEPPTKRGRRHAAANDPFSSYYKNAYVPAAKTLLPQLAERLGDLKNYASQTGRFLPTTVGAVALGHAALSKLSRNLQEAEAAHAELLRPYEYWLESSLSSTNPNSIPSQISSVEAQLAAFLEQARLTDAGCVTGNEMGSEVPYRAVRVGYLGYRRYFYYYINYNMVEPPPRGGSVEYPVSHVPFADIELSGYPSRAKRNEIEMEWKRQETRYTAGSCGDRALITGTNPTDPDGMFEKLLVSPDSVSNASVASMLEDFRTWRAFVFAANAASAQRTILEHMATIAAVALQK